MTSSVISFAYFTHFSYLNISGTIADLCKHWKWHLYSIVEFCVIYLKNQEVQIVMWILYSLPVLATPGDSTSIEGALSTEACCSETGTGYSM